MYRNRHLIMNTLFWRTQYLIINIYYLYSVTINEFHIYFAILLICNSKWICRLFWTEEGYAILSSLSTRFPLFFWCPRYPFQCWHLAFLCAFSSTVSMSIRYFILTNILVFKSIVRHWHTLFVHNCGQKWALNQVAF